MTDPLRQGLKTTREFLKQHGKPDLASYVDTVLAPRGWVALRDSENLGPTMPLSITTTKYLKGVLRAAAAEFDTVLDSLAEEGFRAVLETDWLPSKVVSKRSAPSGEDDSRTVLQVQVDSELKQRVEAKLPELTARAGYRVTVSSVALSWIADELGVRRPGENAQPLMLQSIPIAWVSHWERTAAERRVSLQSVLEDGIRALRDGSWQMPRPVRSAKGSGILATNKVRNKTVRVDAALLDFLDEAAPELSELHGVRIFPGTVAITILKQRLGEPE